MAQRKYLCAAMAVQTLIPSELSIQDLQRTLQFAVGPRPIALVSSINRLGQVNLSPFSYFNIFSTNPPILIFAPSQRLRDGGSKDSLLNVKEVPEVVVHAVSHAMVEQTSLSSTSYERGVNEFIKSGFTALPSTHVAPPRVAESPVALECRVNEVIALGEGPGAGNLVVCEVIAIHIDERILDEDGRLDQDRLDLVGRLGGDWYVRAHGEALFEVEKPVTTLGIGVDALPRSVRLSTVLTGNDLGKLGNTEMLPLQIEIEEFMQHHRINAIFRLHVDPIERREALHLYAKEQLEKGKVHKAWKALLVDRLNTHNTDTE